MDGCDETFFIFSTHCEAATTTKARREACQGKPKAYPESHAICHSDAPTTHSNHAKKPKINHPDPQTSTSKCRRRPISCLFFIIDLRDMFEETRRETRPFSYYYFFSWSFSFYRDRRRFSGVQGLFLHSTETRRQSCSMAFVVHKPT